jgi:hypothetical protein
VDLRNDEKDKTITPSFTTGKNDSTSSRASAQKSLVHGYTLGQVPFGNANKCVYINSNQYFGNVPEVAWNFYIGGYQPAQKWLKDRKGRILTNEDLEHYQKIIIALTETDRIMKEIDKIEIE